MSTDATRCKVCGGPFSTKRIIIEGDQYHERCAVMSYTPHTHEDYVRLHNITEGLRKALQELLRFCDDATEYEATHAYKYNPYIDAKALLGAVGSPVLTHEKGE